MKFTGERVVPDDMHEKATIYSEHLIRYAMALRYCAEKDVLDIACGTGYGTHMLESVSDKVTGGDNDKETLEYARKNYGLDLKLIDLEVQPITKVFKKKFEVIVSFETIEHLKDPQFFLRNVKGALAPKGLFLLSIPVSNRSEFHKHIYSYRKAIQTGNNLFKTLRIFIQTKEMIVPGRLIRGDFNKPGVYIIKVMK